MIVQVIVGDIQAEYKALGMDLEDNSKELYFPDGDNHAFNFLG